MPDHLILDIVVVLGPLILAITIHEYAHVAMAKWLGDDLGERMGRLTLDPLKHIDPIWTVLLPLVLIVMSSTGGGSSLPFFAAGKPAPYNPNGLTRRFRGKRISLRYAELLVAIAGPLSNIVVAALLLFLLGMAIRLSVVDTLDGPIVHVLTSFVQLNIALFVFNLIPIPPLDGSKVLVAFLPSQAAMRFEEIASSASMFVLILIVVGGGRVLGGAVAGIWDVLVQLVF